MHTHLRKTSHLLPVCTHLHNYMWILLQYWYTLENSCPCSTNTRWYLHMSTTTITEMTALTLAWHFTLNSKFITKVLISTLSNILYIIHIYTCQQQLQSLIWSLYPTHHTPTSTTSTVFFQFKFISTVTLVGPSRVVTKLRTVVLESDTLVDVWEYNKYSKRKVTETVYNVCILVESM